VLREAEIAQGMVEKGIAGKGMVEKR